MLWWWFSWKLCPTLFATPWTAAPQAPLSMGFPRQEYWSGLPFPSPGDLPHLGIEPPSPVSPALQADSLPAEPSGKHYFAVLQISLMSSLIRNMEQQAGSKEEKEYVKAVYCHPAYLTSMQSTS